MYVRPKGLRDMRVGRERSQCRVWWASLWVAVLAVGCSGGQAVGESQAAGSTGALVGRAMRGPLSPVGGIPGVREAEPVVGARVQVTGAGRTRSREAVTDDQGDYRFTLPAGTYQVTIAQLQRGEFTKSLPAAVTITNGRETRLDIWIDTGIR